MVKKSTNGVKKASAKKKADAAKEKTRPSAAPKIDAKAPSGNPDGLRSPEEKKSALLAALADALGIALFACKRADVAYEEFLAWRRDDPEFARQVDLIDERAIDFVEGKAFEEKGNARLIQFFLQTKGRGRGYARESAKESAPKPCSPLDFLTDDEREY